MQVAMVEFAVGPDRVDACVAALKGITGTLVAAQPQFHGATVHVEKRRAPSSTTYSGTPMRTSSISGIPTLKKSVRCSESSARRVG